MTEILTESFCERCGTRYTFESAKPKARLKGVKVMSRGLKNFVLSDGTSMDEAMAAARSETDREATAYQLDAFHKTFNFCMQCRQYTCPNCWNEAETRCLTCAPNLGHDVLPAPFALAASPLVPADDPTGGGAILVNGSNGFAAAEAAASDPSSDDFDVVARLDALTMASRPVAEPPVVVEPEVMAEPEFVADVAAIAEPEIRLEPMVIAEPEAIAEPPSIVEAAVVARIVAEPEPVVIAEPEVVVVAESEVVAEPELAASAASDIEAEPEGAVDAPAAATPNDAAAIAQAQAAKTKTWFGRFRPGQDIDAALDAYERDQAAIAAAAVVASTDDPLQLDAAPIGELEILAESVAAEPAMAEPEVVAAEPVVVAAAEPEPVAEAEPQAVIVAEPNVEPVVVAAAIVATSEPELVAEPEHLAAAEPEIAAAAEPTLEPVVVAAAIGAATRPVIVPEAEPVAEPERAAAAASTPVADDVIAQPTWQRVAPDPTASAAIPPAVPELAAAAIASDSAANPEPQWPTRPAWLGDSPPVGLPFLGRPATPQGGLEALWAESNRAVVEQRSTTKPAGVRPCTTCGLSLSASARFCRRCGTDQTA